MAKQGAVADSQAAQGTGSMGTLALVAGEGKLPAILARSAKEKGYRLIALALSEEAEARVSPHADKVYVVAPGQLGRNMKLMQQEQAKQVVFIGKIPKLAVLKNFYKFDWLAVKELSRLSDFSDDTIQRAMGDFCDAHGVKVLTQSEFLRDLFPNVGVLTKQQPNAREYADIEYGVRIAKEIARLDIGQTVIVKDQMIMAIEAIEGTDEAIKRAVKLCGGGMVVVKAAKQNQDQRFDIPAVGMNTLQSMISPKGGGVLAVEANATMVVEREEMIAFAAEHGMCIVAV